ncbi:response regulator transcription factor [Kitasatospora sp. LaBMicrA B282]|uniref:response regulator transcription factor n=1 Tax=Kitasatospora sp. LaBMicrA B282 TaxID=3420949 RepID=UPI003D137486
MAELNTDFSDRERQILAHLADGLTSRTIAHRLALSPHTVETHIRNMRTKAAATTRAHLIALALTHRDPPADPALPAP